MTICYQLGNKLYLNITNRCTNRCDFCIRETSTGVGEHIDLWLPHEPTIDEIIVRLEKEDFSRYDEVIFCGYGEPMMRMDEIIAVAKWLKTNTVLPIRINTNGQANAFYKKDITPKLKGLIDVVSISLNAKNAKEYEAICHSDFGENAFDELLTFASLAKQHVPQVVLTVVDILPPEDIASCAEIARRIGVAFRVRVYSE